MVLPGGAAGEPRVQPVPGSGRSGAIPGGLGEGGHCGGRPGLLVGELEFWPVPGRAAPAGAPGGRGKEQHPVRAKPAQQLCRQVREQERQPGDVIPGVEDDQDLRVALAPVPGGDHTADDVADLGGGDLGLIVIRAQADRVQHRRPGSPAWLQGGHHGVGPARDHLRIALAPPVHVAEQPARAGGRARTQPVAHIHGQHQPSTGGPRQWQGGQ